MTDMEIHVAFILASIFITIVAAAVFLRSSGKGE